MSKSKGSYARSASCRWTSTHPTSLASRGSGVGYEVHPGGVWQEPDRVIRVEPMKVHTIFEGNDWDQIFQVMKSLAQQAGPEGARIVFWCVP
jgi:hypothetical protein